MAVDYYKQFLELQKKKSPKKEVLKNTCASCASRYTIISGMTCCADCGREIDMVDYDPFDGDGPSSCQVDENLVQTSLASHISLSMYGKGGYKNFRDIRRNLIWNSVSSGERARAMYLSDMDYYCESVEEHTKMCAKAKYCFILKQLEKGKEEKFCGQNNKALQAVALYMAYREEGLYRPLKEIGEVFSLDVHHMNIALELYAKFGVVIQNTEKDHINFINRYYTKLRANYPHMLKNKEALLARMLDIADKVCLVGISATPQSLASGIILYVLEEEGIILGKKEIVSELCKISVTTLSSIYSILCKHGRSF